MTDFQLSEEFRQRGPWTTRFHMRGKVWGGFFDPAADQRVPQFLAGMPLGGRLLELAPLEGGHTFLLAPHFREVLALEGRLENIARAQFIRDLLGHQHVAFVHQNLEGPNSLAWLGEFDACLCSGILYHLPRPWELLRQLRAVTPVVFIWTHYADDRELSDRQVATPVGPCPFKCYSEFGYEDMLSGLSRFSTWLRLPDLLRVIEYEYGPAIVIAQNTDRGRDNGCHVTLLARRGEEAR